MSQEDEDILTRWKHLALLVEFALSMQRTLQNINDQSFNHFVLRMGNVYTTRYTESYKSSTFLNLNPFKESITVQRRLGSLVPLNHITTFGEMLLMLLPEWKAPVKQDAFR